MNHPDKYVAKRYDTPNRSKAFTDIVYRSDMEGTKDAIWSVSAISVPGLKVVFMPPAALERIIFFAPSIHISLTGSTTSVIL